MIKSIKRMGTLHQDFYKNLALKGVDYLKGLNIAELSLTQKAFILDMMLPSETYDILLRQKEDPEDVYVYDKNTETFYNECTSLITSLINDISDDNDTSAIDISKYYRK